MVRNIASNTLTRLCFIVVLCSVVVLIGSVTHIASAAAVIYYVDCSAGNDANGGTAMTTAWKTLVKASKATLNPGDQLLLKRGCVFSNQTLYVPRSGTSSAKILIGAYGSGNNPVIKNSTMGSKDIIVNGSFIIVENMLLTANPPSIESGCGNNPKGDIVGISFELGAHDNTLRNTTASSMYAGAMVRPGSYNNWISGNQFTNNKMMYPLDRTANNDAGAVGVLLMGDNNTVTHNYIAGQNACSYDYGRDGSAVEVYGGQNNKVDHNKALDNNTFTELGNSRSANNFYFYNIVKSSLKDSAFLVTRGSTSFGPVANTKAYNNSVYFTGSNSQGVVCIKCAANILTLKNNILWVDFKTIYADAPFTEGYNIYWKTGGNPLVQATINSTSKKVNPLYSDPANFNLYLQPGSPAINKGTIESANSGFKSDYNGTTVPVNGAVDIGAFEYK